MQYMKHHKHSTKESQLPHFVQHKSQDVFTFSEFRNDFTLKYGVLLMTRCLHEYDVLTTTHYYANKIDIRNGTFDSELVAKCQR